MLVISYLGMNRLRLENPANVQNYPSAKHKQEDVDNEASTIGEKLRSGPSAFVYRVHFGESLTLESIKICKQCDVHCPQKPALVPDEEQHRDQLDNACKSRQSAMSAR